MDSKIEGEKVVVSESTGTDANGTPTSRSWDCPPDQAEKHIATWRHGRTGQLSAGDASAIRDAANEYRKQRDS